MKLWYFLFLCYFSIIANDWLYFFPFLSSQKVAYNVSSVLPLLLLLTIDRIDCTIFGSRSYFFGICSFNSIWSKCEWESIQSHSFFFESNKEFKQNLTTQQMLILGWELANFIYQEKILIPIENWTIPYSNRESHLDWKVNNFISSKQLKNSVNHSFFK